MHFEPTNPAELYKPTHKQILQSKELGGKQKTLFWAGTYKQSDANSRVSKMEGQ